MATGDFSFCKKCGVRIAGIGAPAYCKFCRQELGFTKRSALSDEEYSIERNIEKMQKEIHEIKEYLKLIIDMLSKQGGENV